MTVRHFKDLRTWQIGHSGCLLVYKTTNDFPHDERFGLSSQMRRSAVSITSNIAEGMGRHSLRDFIRFLYIARGSVYELLSQLEIAKDLDYISETSYNKLEELYEGLAKSISAHMRSLKQNSATNT